jgi:hypothetical protein
MDDELRRALRRVEPPEGFADRVIQRASREDGPASTKSPQATKAGAKAERPRTFAVASRWAIAATLVAAVSGGIWYRAEERRREQGEEAKRQVLLSLNIAGSKLRAIAIKVNHEEER